MRLLTLSWGNTSFLSFENRPHNRDLHRSVPEVFQEADTRSKKKFAHAKSWPHLIIRRGNSKCANFFLLRVADRVSHTRSAGVGITES